MQRVMLDYILDQDKIAKKKKQKKHSWDDMAKCEQGLLCR